MGSATARINLRTVATMRIKRPIAGFVANKSRLAIGLSLVGVLGLMVFVLPFFFFDSDRTVEEVLIAGAISKYSADGIEGVFTIDLSVEESIGRTTLVESRSLLGFEVDLSKSIRNGQKPTGFSYKQWRPVHDVRSKKEVYASIDKGECLGFAYALEALETGNIVRLRIKKVAGIMIIRLRSLSSDDSGDSEPVVFFGSQVGHTVYRIGHHYVDSVPR